MKKYLEALLEGLVIAFCGFGMLFLPMFAIYIFIDAIPKLTGWSAAGAAIGSCMMLIAGIMAMVNIGLEEIDKDDDAEFVTWIINSGKSEYIEVYTQWSKERK